MTEERNSRLVYVPKLAPGARFVVNAFRMLDCFSDAGEDSITRGQLAVVSGVDISSLKTYLQTGISLGIVVEVPRVVRPGAVPLGYRLGTTPLTQENFEHATSPAGTHTSLVKALWVLSCFTSPEQRTRENIAATVPLSSKIIADNLATLVVLGYLSVDPKRTNQRLNYRRTAKAVAGDKRWVGLVVASTERAAAA